MVLNMPFCTGVRGMTLSSPCPTGVAGRAAMGEVFCVCDREAAYLWTSSLSTRPSLPLPGMSSMLILSSFVRCRTAGVASDACLPVGPEDTTSFWAVGTDCDGSDCEVLSDSMSFVVLSSAFAGLSDLAPVSCKRGSSSGETPWTSMSIRGLGSSATVSHSMHHLHTLPTLAISSAS